MIIPDPGKTFRIRPDPDPQPCSNQLFSVYESCSQILFETILTPIGSVLFFLHMPISVNVGRASCVQFQQSGKLCLNVFLIFYFKQENLN